ncbi:MAG: hypothetical protein WC480_00145 [Patescibacteria group bacterium]
MTDAGTQGGTTISQLLRGSGEQRHRRLPAIEIDPGTVALIEGRLIEPVEVNGQQVDHRTFMTLVQSGRGQAAICTVIGVIHHLRRSQPDVRLCALKRQVQRLWT